MRAVLGAELARGVHAGGGGRRPPLSGVPRRGAPGPDRIPRDLHAVRIREGIDLALRGARRGGSNSQTVHGTETRVQSRDTCYRVTWARVRGGERVPRLHAPVRVRSPGRRVESQAGGG